MYMVGVWLKSLVFHNSIDLNEDLNAGHVRVIGFHIITNLKKL